MGSSVELLAPGIEPQPRMSLSAWQGVIPVSGLVGAFDTSC